MKWMQNKQKINAAAYDASFSLLYKFLAVTAVFAVIAPIARTFLFEGSIPKAVFYLLVGYGFQMLAGRLFQFQRVRDLPDSVSWKRSVNKKLYAFSFIPALILALLAFIEHYQYLQWAFYNTLEIAYDSDPVGPFLTAAVVYFLVIIGAKLWFVPHNRIISYKSVWGLACADAVFFIILQMLLMALTSVQSVTYVLGTAIFILCAMILLNQNYILKTHEHSSDTVLTPSARVYNITLVFMIALAALVVFALTYVLVSGFVMLAKMVVFTLVGSTISGGEYIEAEEMAVQFDAVVFGQGVAGMVAPDFMKIIFGFFVVVIIFAGCYLIFGRGSGFFTKLLNIFVFFYNWLLGFFMDPINARWNFNDIDEDTEYLDRVVMDEVSEQVDYRPKRRDLTYHDFTRAMAALPNDDARIRYAYAALVRHWCTMNLGITRVDTPGEICVKLKNKTELPYVEEMTTIYQALAYAGKDGLGAQNPALLTSMCALVKKYRTA